MDPRKKSKEYWRDCKSVTREWTIDHSALVFGVSLKEILKELQPHFDLKYL